MSRSYTPLPQAPPRRVAGLLYLLLDTANNSRQILGQDLIPRHPGYGGVVINRAESSAKPRGMCLSEAQEVLTELCKNLTTAVVSSV
jgi:hypothetical protein